MKKCKIAFAGDVVIKEKTECFLSKDVKKLIQNHDVASCNFEGSLATKNSKPILKVGPTISQHPCAPKIILGSGFNLINLANNHVFDYGSEALENTLKKFSNAEVVGAGSSFEEAYQLRIININGIKIGFLSFAEWGFGALINKEESGFAWMNQESVNNKILFSKKKVDILIIQVHAGAEHTILPIPEIRERYKEFIELGADLIVGHHPHVVQGWEKYKQKFIFYSLGNFYFDGNYLDKSWNFGAILSVEFDKHANFDFKLIPTKKEGKLVRLCKEEELIKNLIQFNKNFSNEKYLEIANKQAVKLWDERYKEYFYQNNLIKNAKDFIKKILKKRKYPKKELIIYHFLKVESHFFTIKRALKILGRK